MLNRLPRDQASDLLDNRIAFLRELQTQLESKYNEAEGRLLRRAIAAFNINCKT